VNPEDLAERRLPDGDAVDTRSHAEDGKERIAKGFELRAYDDRFLLKFTKPA